MRMAADQFVMNLANHVGHREAALFPCNLRMKDYLEQQIAHLFGKLGVVSAFQSFQNFVGLFDEVGSQRLMRLLAIPRASARRAQSGLNTNELFEPLTGAPLFLIRPWNLPAAGSARCLFFVSFFWPFVMKCFLFGL